MLCVALGPAVVALNVSRGSIAGAVPLGAYAVVQTWRCRPTHRGDHVDHAEAFEAAEPSDVITYWHPGCARCAMLRSALRRPAAA